MRAVAAMVRRSWGYWWGRIVPKRPHMAVTSVLCCAWDEPGWSAGRHVGEPGVAGDPGHRRGGGTWAGEVDPRGVERLPGATTRQGVGGDDGSGGADVVGGRRPVGVGSLQGVELGEDLEGKGRFDGDAITDDPGARLRHSVGNSGAVQRETLGGRRGLPYCAARQQPPVVALPRAQRPVDEDRVLTRHRAPLPLLLHLLYRNTANTAIR